MSPMTYNGIQCTVCGDRFRTVSEYEEHDCDGGETVVETVRGP